MTTLLKFFQSGSSISQPLESCGSEEHSVYSTESSSRKMNSPAFTSRSTPTPQTKRDNFILAEKDCTKLGTSTRQILDHPTIGLRFREYAKKLHADEGLQFLDQLTSVANDPDQVKVATELINTYIVDGAITQVNLSDVIRSELLERHASGRYQNAAELCEDAMYEIFTDLKKSDTFRQFVFEDEEAKKLSSNEAIILDSWMVSENFRIALNALEHDPDLCNLVRFCTSVADYEKEEEKTAKKAKGNKIAANFVQAGCTFQANIPTIYTQPILRGKYGVLADARLETLQILAKQEDLMAAVRKSLTTKTRSSREHSIQTKSSLQQADLQNIFHVGQTRQVITNLLANNAKDEFVNKFRFCSAVSSMMELPGTTSSNVEKKANARKIVANYIQPGSTFQVEVAPGFVQDLCEPNADLQKLIPVVYQQIMADLMNSEELAHAISEIESI